MAERNLAPLLAIGAVAVLLVASQRRPAGGVVTRGNLGEVSASSHGVAKLPGDTVTGQAIYGVSAFRGAVAIPWNYRIQFRLHHVASGWSFDAWRELPNRENVARFLAAAPMVLPADTPQDAFLNLVVWLYAANEAPDGGPAAEYYILTNAAHENAVYVGRPALVVSGSLHEIDAKQQGRYGQGRAPLRSYIDLMGY